jgi:hypothetical protein
MNRYKVIVTDVNATAAAAAHPDGAYVKWTDHVAEVERLKARLVNRTAELVAVQELLVEAEATAQAATLLRQGVSLMLKDTEARLAEAERLLLGAHNALRHPDTVYLETIIYEFLHPKADDTARADGAGEQT